MHFLALSSIVVYLSKVNDPLFSATTFSDDPYYNGWTPDDKMSILGVTEQYQFCTDDRQCGPKSGILDDDITDQMSLTENQYGVALRMRKTALDSNVWAIISALGSTSLLASDYRASDQVLATVGLPENQWLTEAHNMHNISLAVMQRMAVEWASHPHREVTPGSGIYSDAHIEDPMEIVDPPYAGRALRRLCARQKVRSYRYLSFSVLGVSTILCIGLAVIAINCTLSEVVEFCRKYSNKSRSQQKRQEFIETELLQLQRMALDAKGIGPWKGQSHGVPLPVDPGLSWGYGGAHGRRGSDATLTESLKGPRWSQSTLGYQQVNKTEAWEQIGWVKSGSPPNTSYQANHPEGPYDGRGI